MKNKIYAPIFFLLSFTVTLHSQSPELMNYQAVARTSSGAVMANTSVNVEFKIHDLTVSGTVVFDEQYTGVLTNQFGLFTVAIGDNNGTITGSIAGINWGSGNKFMEVDLNGVSMGTTQLLSVPYALFANQANEHQTLSINGNQLSISSGNTINLPTGSGTISYGQQSLYLGYGITNSAYYTSAFITATQEPYSDTLVIVSTGHVWVCTRDINTGQYIPISYLPAGSGTIPFYAGASSYKGGIYFTSGYGGTWSLNNYQGSVTIPGFTVPSGGTHLLFSNGSTLFIHASDSTWDELTKSGNNWTFAGGFTLHGTNDNTLAVMCDGTNIFSLLGSNTVLKQDLSGNVVSQASYGSTGSGGPDPLYSGLANIDNTRMYLIQTSYLPTTTTTTLAGQATFNPVSKP